MMNKDEIKINVTIDRIEKDIAFVEFPDASYFKLPIKFFPSPKEGNVYTITISLNEEEKEKRESEINLLQKKLLDSK